MTNNEKIVIEFDVIADSFKIDDSIDSSIFTTVLLDEVAQNPSNVLRILEINIKKENVSLEQCIVEQNFIGTRIYEITDQERNIQRRRINFMKIYAVVLQLANNEAPVKKVEVPKLVEQAPIEHVVNGDNVVWDLKQKKVTKEGRPRIGKIELTEKVASTFGLPKTRSKTFVTYMFEEIRLALIQGEGVWLDGFANFLLEQRAAKMGMNPLTGERIEIPETTVVKLKSSTNLKETLNRK